MRYFNFIFSVLWCCLRFLNAAQAQLLDDEVIDDTDKSEALFNEMFSDYSETEKDVTKVKTFDDVISRGADIIKNSDVTISDEVSVNTQPQFLPLSGNMFIGIAPGSFKIFKDIANRITCSFQVVLNSELDRDISFLGLNLIYPNRSFAFMFKDIPPHGSQTRAITTRGDICYSLTGTPDIDIHLCKIRSAAGSECVQRLKWDENIKKTNFSGNAN